MERERLEKQRKKAEKEKLQKEKEGAEKKTEEPHKGWIWLVQCHDTWLYNDDK